MTYCGHSNQKKYPFILPELPFGKDDFEPHFTAQTFEYHHGKHHNAYVTNLNNLIKDNKEMMDMDLEQIILNSHNSNAAIFNNAAQIWNHSFFWHSITPKGGGKASGEILKQIEIDFGSFENFVTEFKQAAVSQFGSGWAWLCIKSDKTLCVCSSPNQDNPLMDLAECPGTPILGMDVWEHAYYLHYQNRRADYITSFWNVVNWDEVQKRYEAALD